MSEEQRFTESYHDRDALVADLPVWVAMGKGKQTKSLPGVVKGTFFKGTLLWVDVEVSWSDLASITHTTQTQVRPHQLSRRQEEMPESMRANELTARDCAKDLIRFYVHRGDSVKSLAEGCMGCGSKRYCAQIGGYVHPEGSTTPRDIGCWKIAATRIGERECCEIFSLRQIYEEVQAEREKAGRPTLFEDAR